MCHLDTIFQNIFKFILTKKYINDIIDIKENTMAKKKQLLRMSIVVFWIILAGCSQPTDSDPTYPVWTDTLSYSEYSSIFGSLSDGYYRKISITNSEFNSLSLPNEYRHNWTENEIYNWFLGRDFISSEATELKAWVITTNHCIISSRSGGIVHMLIK
jgi:hypothetical protein